MLERWKLILSNWNDCYFSDSNKNESTLDIESLLNIISHLRENLNFDESKSSALEAHTVKEFIEEKYPGFKFENGTVEPTNEEEVYLVASLLLFFVCVNSKDVDIKSAMCSKLSSEDQKTILQFSKCLMECSEISYSDVKAAITEACGQDIAAMEVSPRPTVAETPPALRSLHSEVRRLQAALDAERFDRNYLQEELNRTNLRVDKLLKEKAQHKLDIVNLKAKISLCGLETESKDADTAADRSAKLARQLQQIEDKLVETQAQLDDSVYERDVYKKKVEELKHERNKYISLSQSEAARVSELSEELDIERRHVQSLKDLITELRQHNQLNKVDSSLLECDDPDASIQSLPHNSSICSEACANVVEVQLGEERAKIVVLKQQIQSLQDQLNELTTKTDSERKTLQNVISDRENNIFNLKHRINEEIEEKNNIKTYYDNEMTKLNNEINELEQKLKDNSEHLNSIIETKMQEIQTLQEEKLSLLHSLNNETTKLENIIKDLQNNLESEKQNKAIMKENYESNIMKLNEKVLNRNNELVELQNSIFEKGEMIETLQRELKKEKEAKKELTKQYKELYEEKIFAENDVQHKKSDINKLQKKLQRYNTIIEEMKTELFDLHKSISELKDKCKILEDAREVLLTDVQNRDIRIEDSLKEVEEITNKFSKENGKLKLDLDEKNAIVHSLQTQLKNEIEFKVQLQNELDNLNSSLQQATVLNEQLTTDLTKLKTDIQDKDKTIDAMDLYIQEEKKLNTQANARIQKLTDHVVKKEKEIKLLKEEVAIINDSLLKEIQTNKDNVEIAHNKLLCEIAEKESLQTQAKSLEEENVQLKKLFSMKCEEIALLRVELNEHLQKINERDALIKYVEKQFINECKKYDQLEAKFEVHMAKVMKRFNEMGKFVVQTTDALRNEVIEKESALQALNIHLYQLRQETDKTNNDLAKVKQEKNDLLDKLSEEILCINKLQEKYDTQCNYLESLKLQFTKELKLLTDMVAEKSEGLNKLEVELILERQNKKKLASEMNSIVKQLKDKVVELESLNNELKQELEYEIEHKIRTIQTLQLENEQLHNTIAENVNAIKENTNTIDKLAQQVLENENNLHDHSVRFENYKAQTKATLQHKDNEIGALDAKITNLLSQLNEAVKTIKDLQKRTEEVVKVNRNISLQLTEEKALRDALETEKEQEIKVLLADKESLTVEKTALTQEILDEKSYKKIAEDEKNVLLTEKIQMKENLAHDAEIIFSLEHEVKELSQQLADIKTAKKNVEKERDSLALKKTKLKDKLQASIEVESELCEEIHNLTRLKDELQNLYDIKRAEYDAKQIEHQNLTEDLKKERTTHNYLLQENQHLTNDNENLTRNLEEMRSINEALSIQRDTAMAEKESLIQSIEIEKTAQEHEINTLRKEIDDLKQTLDEYVINFQTTETKLDELVIELERKDKALSELIEQTDTFKLEKKELINALVVEKSCRDTLNDQNNLWISKMNQGDAELIELQAKYDALQKELDYRTDELKITKQELELLKNNYNEIAEINKKVTVTISAGYDELLEKLKQKRFKDIEVQELEDDTNSDPMKNFKIIKNIAESLINGLDTLNYDFVTVNSKVKELKDFMLQKDAEILNLKANVKQLEDILNENKREFTTQSENYITSMNSKIKDIQTLQEENKSLHNDLNDVKLQLEVKVHSLKEKLVDNENVTDKLKTTYETQIDNLNVMITKLTNYLKEKTNELEAMRKDKENLFTTVADSCKVIKSLEEELESEKQNNHKIVSEFESERLVLKNMVTVTESVMEDQKLSLNNIIAKNLKAIEVLSEENDKLKNNIKYYEAKFNSVEVINDLLRFMLRQERELKMQVENESEIVREYLDELIDELRNEKQSKTLIETEKRQLLADIQICKDNLNIMKEAVGELKETNTIIKKEVHTLRDNLNTITEEKTELQSSLEEKTKLVTESKDLKDKLNEILQEKDDLVTKENSLINKIEVIKEINEEVVKMLKIENEQLVKTVDKITNDLHETQKSHEELKKTKLSHENEIISLKEELTNSNNEKTGLEILLAHKVQQLSYIESECEKMKDKFNELIREKIELIEDKNNYIDKLEETNQANVAKESEEIAKLIEDKEQLSKTVEEKNDVIEQLQQTIKTEIEINTLQKELNTLETRIEKYEHDAKTKDDLISEITKEKDAITNSLTQELSDEKTKLNTLQQELIVLKASIEQDNNTKDDLISEITKTKDAIINSLTQELANEKTKLNGLQQELTVLKASIQQDNNTKDDFISQITKKKDAIINSLTQELSDEKTKVNYLQEELSVLKARTEKDNNTKDDFISQITKEKDAIINSLTQELSDEKTKVNYLQEELSVLKARTEKDNNTKDVLISGITIEKDAIINSLTQELSDEKTKLHTLQQEVTNLKTSFEQCEQENKAKQGLISKVTKEKDDVIKSLTQKLSEENTKIETLQAEFNNLKTSLEQDIKIKDSQLSELNKEKDAITKDLSEEKAKIDILQQEIKAKDGQIYDKTKEKDDIISSLTQKLSEERTKIETLQTELINLKTSLKQCEQDIKLKDGQLFEINKEKDAITKELSEEKTKINTLHQENKAKDGLISKMSKEKDAIINSLTQELSEAKNAREKSEKEANIIYNELKNNMEVRRALMKENDQLTQAVGQQETFAALCQEKAGGEKYLCLPERHDFQVSTTSDTHSSIESLKTISDLEKIIHDKNRTITTLQSDITYIKTLMAESENKLLDVNKELEVTKENCQQLSNQLKKIVYQKNEEIAELRKQVNKMSATETRATQIIKVSAKYHAMILKRIAEIKTNTVLKELTNFGNTGSDNELRRSLNAGTITMEELEHFLDTTDRYLKRCAEKQIAVQKERDRLYEVNRINESEIINLKKFLNELSLSFQTFSSVKNVYAQKLSRVISVQRTVRREILNLEGRVSDAAMCKLERGYAAVMQELAECAMNLERWVERCISRTVSVEKIKQAFTSDSERSSLSTPSFQNTGLEIQLEELEKSFQKLLEEVAKGEVVRETQATTVMEVRAQYEDKLNRMKAKMKELMSEQMSVLKDKQRAEIGLLERELQKTRDKMEEAKRGYEAHIRELTRELWNVGEKYLVKTDEAEWLKRKQHSGSLMSLQHVHSSGLLPLKEIPSRPSDTHSLRSLPVTNNTNKREGRGLHMSDEEGEVFDNRFLKEITATPRREPGGGKRLSELQFRNSLCPPHLKSSYPAETQFVPVVDEEDIKAGTLCAGAGAVGKAHRKEVGITAYKKPGPPTPSKQAGRLSATDSELRESLRVEADPHPADRKTSTPARIRAFLSFKSRDTTDGTPRTRRLSYNIFRKK